LHSGCLRDRSVRGAGACTGGSAARRTDLALSGRDGQSAGRPVGPGRAALGPRPRGSPREAASVREEGTPSRPKDGAPDRSGGYAGRGPGGSAGGEGKAEELNTEYRVPSTEWQKTEASPVHEPEDSMPFLVLTALSVLSVLPAPHGRIDP